MPNGGDPAVPRDAAAQRLRTLHEAARTLRTVSALRDSEAELLQQAIESLAALIGTRYGAVAVTDDHGRLARFVHTGITPENADRIGLLPEGRGLLAAGGGESEPLRIDNIARDPRSAGFPAHHPAMTTLLDVPLTYLDRRFGHIYLSERIDGRPFDENDELLATFYAEELSLQLAFRQSETERGRAAVVLQDIARALSTTSGDNFFQSLVLNLASALGVDYVFIGEPSPDRADVIRTLAFCDHGQLSGNVDYHLDADTPCGSVDCKTICHFPDGAGRLYSGDALIRRYGVEAFIGHPLYDSAGRLLGLLVAMNGKAIADEERVHLILQLCANRAAAEIEHRRAQENVRESEERFQATFSQAAVGIAHVAPDGRFLRINQKFCDIVDYTQAEMLQRSFRDITHPEDVEKSLVLARRMFAGELPTYSLEKRYFRKSGGIVWVNVTVSLVRGPDEQPKYLIAVVEDIAARRAAEVHMRKLS
ncbi:MAG: PAS domain S-box protein, partial [Gammaproteobacteria bacterium]|nr:PAS domain S-box protein [Gammaproteobacteria bacterium]